jgi:hypothetical protein
MKEEEGGRGRRARRGFERGRRLRRGSTQGDGGALSLVAFAV